MGQVALGQTFWTIWRLINHELSNFIFRAAVARKSKQLAELPFNLIYNLHRVWIFHEIPV